MNRGELYLLRRSSSRGPKKQRAFVVVSRQALIESRFTSVICAPVYSQHDGLSTQLSVGPNEGLKKDSSVHCDELMSIPKPLLTHYVGSLSPNRLRDLDAALAVALGLEGV